MTEQKREWGLREKRTFELEASRQTVRENHGRNAMAEGVTDTKQTKIENRWSKVDTLYKVGLGFLTISGLLVVYKDRLLLVFSEAGFQQFPILHLTVVLLGMIIVLVIQWIRATSGEILMLRTYFKEAVPSIPGSGYYPIAGTAILLGTMGYFCDRPVVFAFIFGAYNLFDIWCNWFVTTKFKEMISPLQDTIPGQDPRWQQWDIIRHYYLDHPHSERCVTMLVVSGTALIIGGLALYTCGSALWNRISYHFEDFNDIEYWHLRNRHLSLET